LFGKEYYGQLWQYIEFMADKGTISRADLSLVLLTDSIPEAMDHIKVFITGNYQVKPRKRLWWLFEKR
jgi:predicted Rossmann-fold nucleotide-binding protein